MGTRRPWLIVSGGLLLALAGAVIFVLTRPATPEQRQTVARELLSGVRIDNAVVSDIGLAATGAFADFGLEAGIRLVHVRLIERMAVSLVITSQHDIVLAEPPRVCLVGPFSAPDDAGLEDRCWGEPDIAQAVLAQLPVDDGGRLMLRGGEAVQVGVDLQRGNVRCDYPAGEWLIELKLNPLIDGQAAGAAYIPDTPLTVPLPSHGPLPLLLTNVTRYCGLATVVVQEQGEPEVIRP